jgi:hypothetical protein
VSRTVFRRVAAVLIVALVSAAVCGALAYRAAYGTFAWWDDPARISWCGRVYLRSDGLLLTRADVENRRAALPGDQPYPVTTVAAIPPVIGRPLLAAVTPEARREGMRLPCAMVVYLETGTDSYQPYALSGGP